MVHILVASFFILSFASIADEKLCGKVIDSEYLTNTDIHLEIEENGIYRAYFDRYSSNDLVPLPKGSKIKVLSVSTVKSECSRPHSSDFKDCWLDQTKAIFSSNGNVYTFVVYSPPVFEHRTCTSLKARLSWAVNAL
jgi:hypothetical protein